MTGSTPAWDRLLEEAQENPAIAAAILITLTEASKRAHGKMGDNSRAKWESGRDFVTRHLRTMRAEVRHRALMP